ncbi:MAG: FtsX-like permease family protein [Alphaproteobacteria bacterium]|nr:FtsX-like permease family protein [Alphaproteobacteria bacterium]
MSLAFRLARRELRGGLGGFRVFLACLILGVTAIAGIGSLAAAVDSGLHDDARALLGGDLDFHLFHRTASDAERVDLARRGPVSEVADLRAMARGAAGAQRSLIELKAVDGAYPLYGAVALQGAGSLADALAFRDGHWGAVAEPGLFARIGAKPGDLVRIGDGIFQLRAVLTREPDALGDGFIAFGPKMMISLAGLPATGLIQPGTLVGYSYRLRLPPGTDAAAVAAQARAAWPDAGWRIRVFSDAAPSLQRLLDRLAAFMTLVGLTALLVGGIGIGNAVKAYLDGKLAAIATLKTLGATRRTVFAVYLLQILALAVLGIGIGLLLGAALPFAAAPLLPAALPVAPHLAIYADPLAVAAAFGAFVTLTFALWPLGQVVEIAPASLFRSLIEPPTRLPRAGVVGAVAAAGLALAALAVFSATERATALWFVLGAAAALAGFRLLAAGLTRAARLVHPRRTSLRLALANLHRPGAATAGVVASLGLGLAVLVAVIVVYGDVASEIGQNLPQRAPSFFFIDIQPDQAADFDRLLAGMLGVEEIARVPMLRGRIVALNGVPVERAAVAPNAQWAVRSERGLTYARNVPAGSRIVAGRWWAGNYAGAPLASLDAGLARGMGLKVGDTITVNVLGRDVTATVASLREIDWTSLGLNFVIVLSPGALAGAPHTFVATARTAPADEPALVAAVTDRFANVSAISVRDALATVGRVIDAIAAALAAAAAVTLGAGVLVLAGAIAAGRRRRLYESVMLKVLGAGRGRILATFAVEYGLMGLASAALAAAVGTAAGWLVLTRVMHADWAFLPGRIALTLGLAVLAVLALGYAGTWRALMAPAAPYLRDL